MEFDRKNAIISFLKENEDQKFTSYGIAEWFVENYIEEARLKANASTNKRLLSLSNKKGPLNYVKKGPLYLKIFMSYYPQIYSY